MSERQSTLETGEDPLVRQSSNGRAEPSDELPESCAPNEDDDEFDELALIEWRHKKRHKSKLLDGKRNKLQHQSSGASETNSVKTIGTMLTTDGPMGNSFDASAIVPSLQTDTQTAKQHCDNAVQQNSSRTAE